MLSLSTSGTIYQHHYKAVMLAIAAIVLAILATMGIDFLFASLRQSAFYWSESLLFSVYWPLYLPLLACYYYLAAQRNYTWRSALAAVAICSLIHLLLYPAVVWVLSAGFYPHRFAYLQSFQYGITQYLIITLVVYGFLMSLQLLYLRKPLAAPATAQVLAPDHSATYSATIVVQQKHHQQLVLATADVLYILASSPYVRIHHLQQHYLHHQSLKAMASQLDPQQFVRIHKSCMVNVHKVLACRSRLNGDYDLTLTDGTQLRLSRNYAADFKARFAAIHPLGTK